MKRILLSFLVSVLAFMQMSYVDETPMRKQVGKAPPESRGERWRGYTFAALAVAAGIAACVVASNSHNNVRIKD